jgi:hypothetical protein
MRRDRPREKGAEKGMKTNGPKKTLDPRCTAPVVARGKLDLRDSDTLTCYELTK